MTNNLPRALVFGAGAVGQWLLPQIRQKYDVIAFLDNDKTKQGGEIMGVPVYPPDFVVEIEHDIIIVASHAGVESITEQLLKLGVWRERVYTGYVEMTVRSRIVFLTQLGELFRERGIRGCVAECGVFMGEFAKEINRVFPDSRLYLFDTFSGFDERDLAVERGLNAVGSGIDYSTFKAGHFNITNEDTVLSKLPHPDKTVIRKGFFPETTKGVDETFCFANLDFDLYQPTLAGLEYFYPRMVKGGVILIHDYFSSSCKGVRKAVREFDDKTGGLSLFPVGDGLSIGVNC